MHLPRGSGREPCAAVPLKVILRGSENPLFFFLEDLDCGSPEEKLLSWKLAKHGARGASEGPQNGFSGRSVSGSLGRG